MTKPASTIKKSASSTRLNSAREPLNWLSAFVFPQQPAKLSLYESQLYKWRSKQQKQLLSSDPDKNLPLKMPVSNASWRRRIQAVR